jgi:hypothetical protein
MNLRSQYYRVPVSIANWAVRESRTTMVALFIELKRRSKGHLRLSTPEMKDVCEALSISHQTFYKFRNELIQRNWIGYNKAKKLYHIRSWRFVCNVLDVPGRTNVEGHVDTLKTFHDFCFSVDLANFVKHREKAARPQDPGRKQRTKIKQRNNFALSTGEESEANKLGVVLLAERYGVSKQTISRWKGQAKKGRFLTYKHNYAATDVCESRIHELRKSYPEYENRIVAKEGKCYVQLTDSFSFDIKFRSVRA